MRCTRSALETRPAALASGLDCSSALEGQRLSPCFVGTGGKRPHSGPWDKIVAQVSNLLCRRLPACTPCAPSHAPEDSDGLPIGNRRYSRLETGWKPALRRTGRPAVLRIAGNLAREIRGIALQVTCTANL